MRSGDIEDLVVLGVVSGDGYLLRRAQVVI
jgi:hypothetical protein